MEVSRIRLCMAVVDLGVWTQRTADPLSLHSRTEIEFGLHVTDENRRLRVVE